MNGRNYLIITCFLTLVTAVIFSCRSDSQIIQDKYYINGFYAYQKHCQNCHGKEGEGLAGLIPPLTDTIGLKNKRNRLAAIIKNGMHEPITVNGKPYNDLMPGTPNLADIEVAELIVYITNTFGNKQGMYEYERVKSDQNN